MTLPIRAPSAALLLAPAVAVAAAATVAACAGGPRLQARWVSAAELHALTSGEPDDGAAGARTTVGGASTARATAAVGGAEPATAALLATWMDGPVALIATPAERKAFAELEDDGARAAFIEAFWRRRDADPNDAVNEFRQEFERRVAAADALFGTEDTPGRETVFGTALIAFGFPHSVETHVSGADRSDVRTGALAVPTSARSRDEILWRYLLDERLEKAASRRSSASIVQATAANDPQFVAGAYGLSLRNVRFTYYAGAWRMGCGSQALFDSWWSTGVGVWTPFGTCRGGCGREVALSAPDVPGSGVSTWGAPLTHPEASPVYPPPLVDPICYQFIDQAVLRALGGTK